MNDGKHRPEIEFVGREHPLKPNRISKVTADSKHGPRVTICSSPRCRLTKPRSATSTPPS
jgi:hypothetical protein